MSSENAARIVAEARSYLGTPYHHMADIKGVGIDCALILVRVFCDLGLVPLFDPRPYTKDWFLHRHEEQYLNHLLAQAREVERPEPGDVILSRQGRVYSHGGIVTQAKPLEIIHAFAPAGCVIEERVSHNAALAEKLASVKFFRIKAHA